MADNNSPPKTDNSGTDKPAEKLPPITAVKTTKPLVIEDDFHISPQDLGEGILLNLNMEKESKKAVEPNKQSTIAPVKDDTPSKDVTKPSDKNIAPSPICTENVTDKGLIKNFEGTSASRAEHEFAVMDVDKGKNIIKIIPTPELKEEKKNSPEDTPVASPKGHSEEIKISQLRPEIRAQLKSSSKELKNEDNKVSPSKADDNPLSRKTTRRMSVKKQQEEENAKDWRVILRNAYPKIEKSCKYS